MTISREFLEMLCGVLPEGMDWGADLTLRGAVHIFEAGRIVGRRETAVDDDDRPLTEFEVTRHAAILVNEANNSNLVLTISQEPKTPLAMGNYRTSIEVRKMLVREETVEPSESDRINSALDTVRAYLEVR